MTFARASLYGFLGLIAVSAAHAQPESQGELHIVTSLKPIELLARAIAPEDTRVTTLVPGGGSPHTYQMRPSERKALEQADVIFWVGPEMETFLDRILAGDDFSDRAVSLAGDRTWAEDSKARANDHPDQGHQASHSSEARQEHDHSGDHDGHIEEPSPSSGQHDHHGHDHGDGEDPHVWLDPALAAGMAERIHQRLSAMNKVEQATLDQNLDRFLKELAQAEQTIHDRLNTPAVRDVSIFTYHDAFGRFAEHYGLSIAGVLTASPERTPGAKHLAEVQGKLADAKQPCLLTEPQFNRKWWRSITENIEIQMSTWDPLASDISADAGGYVDFQFALADAVLSCLPEQP
ncbi:zinc ABC transporter substrate-binding protein [Marinobacter salicampi]|uniref:zinc ABC transporter substrate-binding protein n=1 Tax=Marinobacter salicampi TaxID=435907 RepID=UPI00140BDD1B|nr:zinc ABC transporter substrate-binding protein [Marinobacter salicampi]